MIAKIFGKEAPKIEAKPWMGEIYWRLEALKNFFTGQTALVTKETARAGQRSSIYSNQKVRETLNYKFYPLKETIDHIASLLKKELF